MKSILLFALFGLSFFRASGDEPSTCSVSPSKNPDDKNCLPEAVKKTSKLFVAISNFLCYYDGDKGSATAENYETTSNEYATIMMCVNCNLKNIFGPDATWEWFQKEIIDTKGGGKMIVLLAGALGIDKMCAWGLCKVAGPILTSECLKNVLQNSATDMLISDLTALYCKSGEQPAKDTASKVMAFLKNTGCAIKVQSESSDDVLEKGLESIGNEKIKDITGHLLAMTNKVDVVNDEICSGMGGGSGKSIDVLNTTGS